MVPINQHNSIENPYDFQIHTQTTPERQDGDSARSISTASYSRKSRIIISGSLPWLYPLVPKSVSNRAISKLKYRITHCSAYKTIPEGEACSQIVSVERYLRTPH